MTTTTASTAQRLPVRTDSDVVKVRQLVRALAQQARLSLVDQTKLVTAASELARNTLVYGGGGEPDVRELHRGRFMGRRLRARRRGG